MWILLKKSCPSFRCGRQNPKSEETGFVFGTGLIIKYGLEAPLSFLKPLHTAKKAK
jgi:hypothetical protein